MMTNISFELFEAGSDPASLTAISNTITLSFAEDPLIRWLRPNATHWAIYCPGTCKWEYRRVQRAILEGIILRSASTAHMKKTVLSQIPGLRSSLISESISGDNDNKNAGMVALLYPPSRRKRWSFLDFLEAMRLWALDLLDPATDEESQQQRVIQMTNAHSAAMRSIESRYGIDNLWYLEVVAVDPSRQGCGIGRLAMARILDQAGNNPMVLECTAERNLRFYVSLGFVVVEEMGLVDEPDIVKLWVMLRQAKHKGKMD